VVDRSVKTDGHDLLYYGACCLNTVLFLSCFYLFNVVQADKFYYSGTKPSKIIIDYILADNDQKTLNEFLKIRIDGLQKAITNSQPVHDKRLKNYERGFNTLMIGTGGIFIIFSLYHLGQAIFFPNH